MLFMNLTGKLFNVQVAITNVMLWVTIWSPYAFVNMIAVFGNQLVVTPLVSQIPAFIAKAASCFNPVVYAISHPKYREALSRYSFSFNCTYIIQTTLGVFG